MPEARLRVDEVMGEIERDVRTRLRRHLIKRGGAAEYEDEALFDAVHAVLARAVDERNLDATLLPELLDSDVDWRLKTHLELSTHRPATPGRWVVRFRWVWSRQSTSPSINSGSSIASGFLASTAWARSAWTAAKISSS